MSAHKKSHPQIHIYEFVPLLCYRIVHHDHNYLRIILNFLLILENLGLICLLQELVLYYCFKIMSNIRNFGGKKTMKFPYILPLWHIISPYSFSDWVNVQVSSPYLQNASLSRSPYTTATEKVVLLGRDGSEERTSLLIANIVLEVNGFDVRQWKLHSWKRIKKLRTSTASV